MEKYILTVDQSTSGTKAIIFNKDGKIIIRENKEHKQIYPQAGWAEHDPEEIYFNVIEVVNNAVKNANISFNQIKIISITNQRETALVWNKVTGKPIFNAVVWQCQRGKDICNQIENEGYAELIENNTGLKLSPYFSAAKIKWILENSNYSVENRDNLVCGTIDSWLIYKLSGGLVHATDYSNASRTQLFNINTLTWDKEILSIFDIPLSMMAEVKYSDETFCVTEEFGDCKIPISGVIGDSHAALFGQCCFNKGTAKVTYGTGSSIMMNIGKKPLKSHSGIVTSIAWGFKGEVNYVFEGNINSAGATLKWLKDSLNIIDNINKVEEICLSVNDNGGVYFVPAFVGLSAPYWDYNAKALICGISFGTEKAHIIRAGVESIAFQVNDIVSNMSKELERDMDNLIIKLSVDGGPTNNRFLMQLQSDLGNLEINSNSIEEISAMGSAFMAGISIGYWKNFDEIISLKNIKESFTPKMDNKERVALLAGWKNAIDKTLEAGGK